MDCIVSTAGGIEEDFIKCLAPTYLGDFSLPGRTLRSKGINRIGNLLVPNSNYCLFEDWLTPILDALLEEQQTKVLLFNLQYEGISCRKFEAIDNTGNNKYLFEILN